MTATPVPPVRRPRDPRLDFFRGLAMFIILLAHTPGNTWTLWIPARFGFSDATEIFVFCSGMASSLAFGTVFMKSGWALGAARVAFRVWQVYWAHIGVFIATATLLFAIDHYGIGLPDKVYRGDPYILPFFRRPGEALAGLLTLGYVPALFDILPMYLVILAMIPVVMALHRAGGGAAVAAFMAVTWFATNLAGYAMRAKLDTWTWGEGPFLHDAAVWAGSRVQFLNLPYSPWGDGTWFFNPFGWQILFFTGFAFGMGWLKPPPVDRRLILLALVVLIVSVPFAWFKIYEGWYLAPQSALQADILAAREALTPLHWKTWQGIFRYLHFLALAYVFWVAAGPRGQALSEGPTLRARSPGRRTLWACVSAVAALATAPYAYVPEIRAFAPALDAWLTGHIPLVTDGRIGWLELLHVAAMIVLVWNAAPQRFRTWMCRDAWFAAVPVIRKVGTQSLAVFMVSVPLSQFNGLMLDLIGRDIWTRAAVNVFGFAVLIATAYVVGWFKGHPWRSPAPAVAPRGASSTPAE